MAAEPISNDFIIACEGESDEAFFRHLCTVNGINGFSAERTGGNSGFKKYFQGLLGRSGLERLKGVIAVGDNDDSPDKSFKTIRDQLKKAKVPAPDKPLEVMKYNNIDFSVAVLMVPFVAGKCHKGCLETLLLRAASVRHSAIHACVETYVKCVEAGEWPNYGAIDKLRLRCLLSAVWPDDPNLGLQYALSPDKDLIPLQDPCFSEIVEYIRAFPANVLVAPGRRT